MKKMKNLQLLENCFSDSENIRDAAKMEAISSKLIRQNTRLQKEKEQLAKQARKQEVCISHLLKKLEQASDLAKEQQTSFDEALHQQTETVASMLQELSKSRNEIAQLQKQLEMERVKNESTQNHLSMVHRIPTDDSVEDFADDITVQRKNVATRPQKDVTARKDTIGMFRYPVHYTESTNDIVPESSGMPVARRVRHNSEDTGLRGKNRDRFRPDDDIEMMVQHPFAQHSAHRMARSGLQEVDTETPRPPLSRQSSGVRGSTQSPVRLPASAGLNSRSFAMDAVRLSGSSRSLGASF